jgi:hypothetical protein
LIASCSMLVFGSATVMAVLDGKESDEDVKTAAKSSGEPPDMKEAGVYRAIAQTRLNHCPRTRQVCHEGHQVGFKIRTVLTGFSKVPEK